MRLESMTLANFRGFAERQTIPFDGDMVIIWGANGTGKTSLFDALEWAFRGSVPRLEAASLRRTEDAVGSRYATAAPFVSVELRNKQGVWTINRTGGDRSKSRLTITSPDGAIREHDEAESFVRELVGHEDLSLRTYVLQQDALTELLSGDTRERYRFLADVTGLEGLRGMDEQLRSELRRLRSGLKERRGEVDVQRQHVLNTQREFEETLALVERQRGERQERVLRAAEPLAARLGLRLGDADAVEARARTVIAECKTLLSVMAAAQEVVLQEVSARDEARSLDAEITRVSHVAASAEASQAEVRSGMDELQRIIAVQEQRRNDLQQLAALALEHLGPPCPVCGQDHVVAETRSRLRALLDSDDDSEALRERLKHLDAEYSSLRQARLDAEIELESVRGRIARLDRDRRAVEDARARLASARDSFYDLLRIDLPGEDAARVAAERISELETLLARLEDARLELGQLGALENRAAALQDDLTARRARLEATERDVGDLSERGERAEAVCRWVGDQSRLISAEIMDRAAPLADALFRRFDVHPTFRRFAFQAERVREAGHLRPWVFDDVGDQDGNAVQVLSAAQLNALAVSLFLALNLEEHSRLEVALLDDPVQNMDDLNVLSLIDVLRAIRSRRQIVLTTHDIVLAQLLQTKLRPLAEDQQTLLIKLSRWTPRGPSVETEARSWDPGLAAYQLVGARDGEGDDEFR